MQKRNINKVLIANRGVPAVRIINTCRGKKISTVAVYSTPDRLSHHVFMADSAVHIGEAPPVESYLNIDNIIRAALESKSDAIHPGWGFLAESAKFAKAVEDAGLIWIGPGPEVIELMGDKIRAKQIAQKADVPVIPGIDNVEKSQDIIEWMQRETVDYPILIKASSGGGGKGMVKAHADSELSIAIEQAKSEARKSFGDDSLLVEKYIENGKHIEIQIIADQHGNTLHLYDRECTIQRRNQKIVEESPSPSLDENLRMEICQSAVTLMKDIGYASAGTVEFMLDVDTRKYYFLEVNTRLQVEHGITELVTGLDIVSIMLDIATGSAMAFQQSDILRNRTALEVRINAEDPRNFSPSFGTISRMQIPHGPAVRVLEGVYEGSEVPPYYDSLFMLVMSAGRSRQDAIDVMDRILNYDLRIEGVKSLQPLLLKIIRHPVFLDASFTTQFLDQNLAELVATISDKKGDDEVLKIAQYVADITALGPQSWM